MHKRYATENQHFQEAEAEAGEAEGEGEMLEAEVEAKVEAKVKSNSQVSNSPTRQVHKPKTNLVLHTPPFRLNHRSRNIALPHKRKEKKKDSNIGGLMNHSCLSY